ncbi:MAG: hypothetical protein ACU0CO_17290 [Shimia sp.]
MAAMIWIGTALTLVGIAMLGWCILLVARARRAGLEDAAMRKRLEELTALNMGALAVSGLGLVCVVVGLVLA